MEDKNKKLFSTLLFAVGTLFIVVAGAIFISRTWGYLPEGVKKFILILVTIGFFSASNIVEIKWNLKKASLAFYYLGVCFTGYTLFSISSIFIDEFLLKLVISQVGMALPVFMRFNKNHSILDLIIEMILTDGMAMCLAFNYNTDGKNFLFISLAYVTCIFAALAFYTKKVIPDSKEINIIIKIGFYAHLAITLYLSLLYLFEDHLTVQAMIGLTLVFISFQVFYYLNNNKELRVCQSCLIYYYSFYMAICVCRLVSGSLTTLMERGSLFFAFVVGITLMIITRRKETVYINLFIAFITSLMQVSLTAIFNSIDEFLFPYAIVFSFALFVVKYRENDGIISSRVKEVIVAFTGMGCINLAANFSHDFAREQSFPLWVAMFFLLFAALTANFYVERSMLRTIALAITTITICVNPLFDLSVFNAEYITIIGWVAIVLLGFIWYDRKEAVRFVQFVLTLISLVAFLLYILTEYRVEHILFFSITNLIILLVSTYLKKKNYAISSAAGLVITVIYATRAIWMSIAWWIYLFVAGIALVLIAIKREKAE